MRVTAHHRQLIKNYFSARPEVVGVYLYGSHARGEAGPLSDIDIGVLVDESKFEKGKSETRYRLDYIDLTMQIFQTDEVDAQVLSSDTPLAFAFNVINEGRLILSNDDNKLLDKFTAIGSKYYDYLPVLNRHYQAMDQRLKEGTYGVKQI